MVEIKLGGFFKENIPDKYISDLVNLLWEFEIELNHYPITRSFVENTFIAYLPNEIKEFWVLAFHKESMIGYGYCDWQVKFENLNKGSIRLFVSQKYRRKQIGLKMLNYLLNEIEKQVDIISIMSFQGTPGQIFLSTLEGNVVFTEEFFLAKLSDFSVTEIKNTMLKLSENVESIGFQLELLDTDALLNLSISNDFAKTVERIWNDIPAENQTLEEISVTPERLHEIYKYRINRGDEYHSVCVIQKKSEKIVGYTIARVNIHQPNLAIHHDTGVIAEFRGKNLGFAMKYKLLQYLKDNTQVNFWETSSAKSNIYMRRINEKLKHKPTRIKFVYEFQRKELHDKTKQKL